MTPAGYIATLNRRVLTASFLWSLELLVSGEAIGTPVKEIAGELGITNATVKCHVSTILMRLNVSDRTQAVVAALQRGLFHL